MKIRSIRLEAGEHRPPTATDPQQKLMKGGKADKPRRSSFGKPAGKPPGARPSKGAPRPASGAPKKGSRKRPDVGGGSSTGQE